MSHEPLDGIEFTIFDTETTGLDPSCGDRIIEIAGIRVRGHRILGQYDSLINPQRPVSPAAFSVHGIPDELLSRAPVAAAVIPGFLAFIEGSVLCAYNIPFDLSFLKAEASPLGLPGLDRITTVDILKMARRLLPGMQRYALWFVAATLGIKQDQLHRARSDVDLTWKVFRVFTDMLKRKGVNDGDGFLSLFAEPGALMTERQRLIIARIEEAIGLGAKVRMEYASASGVEVTQREVVPQEIKQLGHGAYLVGHCCLRNEERTFRVDGILQLEIV